jgi:glycosyltransferase involved in cell wall biosynthesis
MPVGLQSGMKRAALYLCYYNITEPLVQTQVVAYLRELARSGFEIHLLTFEKERMSRSRRLSIRERLRRDGIEWYALRYHSWPSLPATLYDIARGSLKAVSLCIRHQIPLVHGRSHVGAAMALVVKLLRGVKMLFDVRGLLADEYADVGHWTRASVKYRLTKAMERVLFRRADALILLTEAIKADLVRTDPVLRERACDIEVIPCCVPVERFILDAEERRLERRRRGWGGRRVLAYVGKLGTWYLVEEMARFFAVARQEDSRFFFQVLTQSEPSSMRRALKDAGVPPEAFDIGHVEPEEVPGVLCAADAGISFIRPCYSKRSSSPTKVAEYLAAGLPVVSTQGIGDCDEILARPNLGVVVERLDEAEYRRAARGLLRLLDDPATPALCRKFAERELSLGRIGGPRYVSVYERLCRSVSRDQAMESRV